MYYLRVYMNVALLAMIELSLVRIQDFFFLNMLLL